MANLVAVRFDVIISPSRRRSVSPGSFTAGCSAVRSKGGTAQAEEDLMPFCHLVATLRAFCTFSKRLGPANYLGLNSLVANLFRISSQPPTFSIIGTTLYPLLGHALYSKHAVREVRF